LGGGGGGKSEICDVILVAFFGDIMVRNGDVTEPDIITIF